jgi:hypothetical protein
VAWRKDQGVRRNAATPTRGNAAPRAIESKPTLRLGRRALAGQTDRRIEENVMARKKDKKAQKDKKGKSAKGAPAAAETAVAPSASPRPKKS